MVREKVIEDIGVIIGRFQVHELHRAHLELIDYVKSRHNKIVILLGLAPVKCTIQNPLDFESRRVMFDELNIRNVHYIHDNPSDEVWSKNLDELLETHYPNFTYRLYGGRDSFIQSYKGKYSTEELVQTTFISGSAERKRISLSHDRNSDFRAGVIFSTFDRFPTSYQTVDMIVYDKKTQSVLLGKKKNIDGHYYRLFGGFVDVNDSSLEGAAKRELHEEAGIDLNVSSPVYIGSSRINDWRYRKEKDKIMTALFGFQYLWGQPSPGSDIDEVKWVQVSNLYKELAPFHMELIQKHIETLNIALFTR